MSDVALIQINLGVLIAPSVQSEAEEAVKRNPISALAIALGLGFLIGAYPTLDTKGKKGSSRAGTCLGCSPSLRKLELTRLLACFRRSGPSSCR